LSKNTLYGYFFIFFAIFFCVSDTAYTLDKYKIYDLKTLGMTSNAWAINDAGQAVGSSLASDTIYHGFIWYKESGIQDLGIFTGDSGALSINNKRRVVGYSTTAEGYHAFLWAESTGLMDLGTLGGSTSIARDINDAGYIVGESKTSANKNHAFAVFDYLQAMVDIGVLPGHTKSYAMSVNNNNYVVGYSEPDCDTLRRAFIWHRDHGITDITPDGWTRMDAMAINDLNQVTGSSRSPSSQYNHAYIWDQTSGMRDIGTLGGNISIGYAINNKGVIVGASNTSGSSSSTVRAFIWSQDEGMRDLNDLLPANSGWVLLEAHSINESGQIVGLGTYNGVQKGFMLMPMQYYTDLEAIYLWDGKTSQFRWSNYCGKAKLVRKTTGETKVFQIDGANTFTDNTMILGKTYTYYLEDSHGILLTNKVTFTAEVVVVLVRGYYYSSGISPVYWWSSTAEETRGLVDTPLWLNNHGITCWDPNFDTSASQIYMDGKYSIEKNVNDLYLYIQEKMSSSNQPPAKIYLIGHEIGGLIARRLVEKYNYDGFVDAIFTINTPHTGTPFAKLGSILLYYNSYYDMFPEKMFYFNALNRTKSTKLYSIWSDSFSRNNDPFDLIAGANEIMPDPMFVLSSGSQSAPSDGFTPALSMRGIIRDYQGNNPVNSVVFDGEYQINFNHDASHKNTLVLEKIVQWMGVDTSYYENENDAETPVDPDNGTYNIPQNKVFNRSYTLNSSSGNYEFGTFTISSATEANFMMHTSDPSCTYTLKTPSGIVINPAYALANQNVDYDNEGGLRVYTVSNPEEGVWKAYITSSAPTTTSAEYVLSVFERNDIKMKTYTPSTYYNTSNTVTIFTSVMDGTSPINNATVTASVYRPGVSTPDTVTLYNDGTHNDGTNSDGIYAAQILPSQQGYYFIHITSSGTSLAGKTFQRLGVISFSSMAKRITFRDNPSDSGVDLDNDSKFDKIKFEIPALVLAKSKYVLSANLCDSEDNLISGLSTGIITLDITSNKVDLEVSTEKLREKSVSGTLKLKNIEIYDANTGLKITRRDDIVSSSYNINQYDDDFDTDYDGLLDDFENQIGTNPADTDSDNDGLSDYDELNYDGNPAVYTPGQDTDPLNPDTDNDGFPDCWEIVYGFNPLVNEGIANLDPDNDGLTNMQEYMQSTSPFTADTDNDQMPDAWEIANNMNPHVNNKYSDTDGDLLTDYDEYVRGTELLNPDCDNDGLIDGLEVNKYSSDPFDPDSDNDGLQDGIEADFKTNPTVSDANLDYDNDTLTNIYEITRGLSPVKNDSDADGIKDNDEITQGTSPLMYDTDHDGVYDKIELVKGNNPVDSQSYPTNVFNPYGFDLNQDGYPDIVFSNYSKDNSYLTNSFIYWGTASGFSSATKSELPTQGCYSNIVFDINRDSYLDILFANYYDGTNNTTNSFIYWGSAGGFSTSNRAMLPGKRVMGASIADLNKDGHYDIVFANYADGTNGYINSYIYWGSSAGYSSSNITELPTHYAHTVSTGDLNGDGWLDIVFCNYRELSTYYTYSTVFWGSETGFNPSDATDLETNRAFSSSVADLNYDGYMDITFSNMATSSSYASNSFIYWGNYSGYSNNIKSLVYNNGATANTVVDLNYDGYLDIIFSNYADGSSYNINSIVYWGTSSSSYILKSALPTSGAYGNAVGDLNKDGYLDIVFSNTFNGSSSNINSVIYWGSSTGLSTTNKTLLPTCAAIGVSAGSVSSFSHNYIQTHIDTILEVNRLRYGYQESAEGYIRLIAYTVTGKTIKGTSIFTSAGNWVGIPTETTRRKSILTTSYSTLSQAQNEWKNGEYYLKMFFNDGDILVKEFKKYPKEYPAWVDMIYPVHNCKTPTSFIIKWTGEITGLEIHRVSDNVKVAEIESGFAGMTYCNVPEGLLETGKEYIVRIYRNSGPPYYCGSVTAAKFKVENSTDWDCDGMPNTWEQANSFDQFNPLDGALDADGDGLSNLAEYQNQTLPRNADTDGDGIPDGFEVQYGLNPKQSNTNIDTDQDTLYDYIEYTLNINPTNPDTDGDGMHDGFEVNNSLDPKQSNVNIDTDNDGLMDPAEYSMGTNIKNADTDGDGIPDGFEVNNSLNPKQSNANSDADNDGLTDSNEYSLTTDIFKSDTDNDGIPDGFEVSNSLDPKQSNLAVDSDQDGLTDPAEYSLGTNIKNADTDGDGIPDGFEVNNSLDPKQSNANSDADNDGLTDPNEYSLETGIFNPDTDSDGMTDGQEVFAGFDPKDGQSKFIVLEVATQQTPSGIRLTWPASSRGDIVYRVFYKDSTSVQWAELQLDQADIITNTDGSKSYVDSSAEEIVSGVKVRLYRVVITAQ